ncbi:MAG: Gfo/Idh/MocA family oxidoreductase [Anaerolineae bacterium]|nr:Gfo/Idh/MocA family oxidoreductase [Anaerolineae bacterium]
MIKVGLLGLGAIADMHRQAIHASSDFELVAGFTRNRPKLEALAKEWQFRSYTSVASLLDDGDIDAVIVLTPSSNHHEHASMALKAGKHVLVEKPVALGADQVHQLERLANKLQRVCMPGHCSVYRPVLQRAKAIIRSGRLGIPYFGSSALAMPIPDEQLYGWRSKIAYGGGGALIDSGTHRLYQLIHLMGAPCQVFAWTHNWKQVMEGEDVALLSLRFESGALGSVFQSWVSRDSTIPEIRVLGTEGSLWISDALYLDGEKIVPQLPRQDSFNRMLQQFADCILKGTLPIATMQEAELTARTIQAAYDSTQTATAINLCDAGQGSG